MFKKCVSCKRLGESCGGPDFYLLSADELISWCRQRKEYLHLSNAKIAEAANMPRGTVDSFFANTHADFRYETIRPILKALIGDKYSVEPCQAIGDAERTRINAEIEHVHSENERLASAMQREHDEHQQSMEFVQYELSKVRETSNGRKKLVYILATCLFFTMFLLMLAFYFDLQNPDVGFIFRDAH